MKREAATDLIVNEAKIRQRDAIHEVWLFDYHPSRISKQAAFQRWGWTNEISSARRNECS
jgi:hypothetical protein